MSDPYYRTAAWQRLRAAVLRRDPICRACGLEPSRVADHIEPRAHGGPDSLGNLRGLCASCHNSRRHGVGPVRPRGCDATGQPRDAGHWWNDPPQNLSELGVKTGRGAPNPVSFRLNQSGYRGRR